MQRHRRWWTIEEEALYKALKIGNVPSHEIAAVRQRSLGAINQKPHYRPKKAPFAPDGLWEWRMEQIKDRKPVDYKMTGTFSAGDKLHHIVFGLGYVYISFSNKIAVLFKEGVKLLITGGTNG
jgi:hypothetical protein